MTLSFTPNDPRLRRLNDGPTVRRGEFVLYWMQAYLRSEDNAALAWAIDQANELGVPCLVLHALLPDTPYACDRTHRFIVEAARGIAEALEARGVAYALWVPRTRAQARGVVEALAARACVVVSDDFPSGEVPRRNAELAARTACAYVVVDDCCVVPLALLAKEEAGARTIRPKVLRSLPAWLAPIDDPNARVSTPGALDLPFDPVDARHAHADLLVRSCAIDHSVPPVVDTPGGPREAARRLDAFVRGPLATYDADRNDPSRAATSGLSPYLHFGMVSARRVALEARRFGKGEALGAFLEQLLVRRALSFNFARARPDHANFAALPAWARKTLEDHAGDPRYARLSVAQLEAAQSPDALWNAAMRELRERGVMKPYARMLWGKLPITWMARPSDAHAAVVHLNDKWTLDGCDPNGYANISWCFGLHDRPWPSRPVFGAVRTMTTASARRKLDFEPYLATWGER